MRTLRVYLLSVSLSVLCAASSVSPTSVLAEQPERFWLAGQYDGQRVIVYFDAVQFGSTFPEQAPRIPSPVVFGFFQPQAVPASVLAPFKQKPDAEHFELGDRYELLTGRGEIFPIRLTTLVATQGDELVGNDSYIGALATVELESALLFAPRGYYVVRRLAASRAIEDHRSPDRRPPQAGLSDVPVRFDVQTALARLLNQRLTRDAGATTGKAAPRPPIAFTIQPFYLADSSLRYYVRAEWRNTKDANGKASHRLAAWIRPGSTPRILAVQEPTSGEIYGFESALPNLLNIVDLGQGRTGLVVRAAGEDSTALTLYEYRDGVTLDKMRVLQSIGAGE